MGEVVVAIFGLGLGLALVGLGCYFIFATWPYLRLLHRAGEEVVENYNAWRKGEVWEVVVSVGSRRERHMIAAAELGSFMLRQALGSFYEKEKAKAKAIEAEAAAALGESLIYEWVQVRNTRVMEMDKRMLNAFSVSRREVLDKVGAMLSGTVALRERELQAQN